MIYAAVLVAGLHAWLSGLGATLPVLFVGGLAALAGLELFELRRFSSGTPRGPAIALLCARIALFTAVATADGSGLSRALFVLVPFTAYFAFGRTVAVALAVACAILAGAANMIADPHWYADVERLSDLLMFTMSLVLTVTMAAVAVEEGRARARLAASSERIAELSADAERTRLARDIHDDLGHHLTAIIVLLEKASAYRDLDPGAADRAVADAHGSARRALNDVRRSVRSLREDAGPFRFSDALRALASETTSVTVTGQEREHDRTTLMTLYRAAQEGVTNASRHARARRVSVTAAFEPDVARLVVTDDGRGYAGGEGYGLLGMRERVELAGGRLSIKAAPSGGTRLTVTIPRMPPS
ncbi:sensor histidine kinase [Sinosporangium siamense]|uniref:sensor histidine kinase n=1 Tax=Sinosporangium siamense TaxID=1367973 RepID=UPI00195272CB|nr:sensor histidine kinase [Sinosporangium siamense]